MIKSTLIAFAITIAGTVCAAPVKDNTPTKPESWGNIPYIVYPTTKAIFYGSEIDLSRKWNPCVGRTDGGIVVHMTQQILPIQNCQGEYVVVRKYTLPDGTLLKQTLRRLSDGPVPI